jgi:hypothetical protein
VQFSPLPFWRCRPVFKVDLKSIYKSILFGWIAISWFWDRDDVWWKWRVEELFISTL